MNFANMQAKEILDNDESVLFVTSYDYLEIRKDDPHCMGAFVLVTDDLDLVVNNEGVWLWIPVGGGGQYYIQTEMSLNDFYRLMFGIIKFDHFIPYKVLFTYYRR
ncbi:hypothetical protein LCGC14_1830780 [marine sediment metagenome]|uniref:Uncharacterized protein n=1 Tax=marine sediment metagenome TaxID=412755 RepID=A0A0F9H4A8_9ZZZZ